MRVAEAGWVMLIGVDFQVNQRLVRHSDWLYDASTPTAPAPALDAS